MHVCEKPPHERVESWKEVLLSWAASISSFYWHTLVLSNSRGCWNAAISEFPQTFSTLHKTLRKTPESVLRTQWDFVSFGLFLTLVRWPLRLPPSPPPQAAHMVGADRQRAVNPLHSICSFHLTGLSRRVCEPQILPRISFQPLGEKPNVCQ